MYIKYIVYTRDHLPKRSRPSSIAWHTDKSVGPLMEHEPPILSSRIAGKGNNYSNNDRLCIRIGLTESSNMLHYSNASSIEKNRRYLVIKGGGLPGCSGKKGSPSM